MLAAAAVIVAVVALGLVAAHHQVPWWLITRRQVAVNLRDGDAFTGVLWARRGGLLVLRNATHYHGPDKNSVDGEVVIERSRVGWMQVVPRGTD